MDLIYLKSLLGGFLCFSLVASGIYILNDLRDLDYDKIHPVKKSRPLASGLIKKNFAIILMVIFWFIGILGAYFIQPKFLLILGIYWIINIGYCLGLKNISLLDIILVSLGFVLRVKAGGALTDVFVTNWLTIMIFLLSLVLAIAKRRDDIVLKMESGLELRKSIKGYNLDFLNLLLGLVSGIIIVSYILYTLSPEVIERHNNFRLYYTSIFVLAGIFRYLQIALVESNSGSPTKILFKDRFIQICIFLWMLAFSYILYAPEIRLFNK